MASTNQTEQKKLALLSQIEESRQAVLGAKLLLDEQVAAKKSAVAEAINVPKKVKTAFSEKPAKSFGVALASGLGASLLLKKKKKKKKEFAKREKKPFLENLAFAVLKPVLQRMILQFSQQWLIKRAQKQAVVEH